MLYVFLRQFTFTFLVVSTTSVHLYAAMLETTLSNLQNVEEKKYFEIQKILLTELGKIPQNQKETSSIIGKAIAQNASLKKKNGFSASFTTFDDIKDKVPQINSELSAISETYAESNLTTQNTEADLSSSPHDTILTSDSAIILDSLFDLNDINTNLSPYSNPFACDQEEKKEYAAQLPVVFSTSNKNNDEINPFAQNPTAGITVTTSVTESTSTDSSSERRKQHKKDTPWLRRLFCIAPVN